jgi:Xaa-Pro dipeptidase
VPAGVLELVRAAGAVVVSSGELVSRFYAAWNATQIAAHRRAAAMIAETAVDALRMAGEKATIGSPLTEFAIQEWILERIARAGLATQDAPIVATGPHASNPHYGPSEAEPTVVNRGDVLLIDLWAREPGQPFADQTWMGVLGNADSQTVKVWEAVRDARDAAIRLLRERATTGQPIRGSEVDDAARAVIASRGYGAEFSHRTGHSIDPRDIHGSGPHIDNLESRDDRLLIPGVAFSIEPGIYIKGVLGVRSEVNAVMQAHDVLITPDKYQRELLIV